jgi:phosphopantothenate synthetase
LQPDRHAAQLERIAVADVRHVTLDDGDRAAHLRLGLER